MKRNKQNRIYLVVTLLLSFALSGCQLAREGGGEGGQDRLMGVLITKEYLLSFAPDWQQPGGGAADSIEEIIASSQRPERLYATLVTRTLIDEETGATSTVQEYVFEGVEAIPFFAYSMPATEERASYVSTSAEAAITNGHAGFHYGDDEDSITLEGTIYVSTDQTKTVWHINSVYQSADGGIYAMPGNGISNSHGGAAGTKFSTWREENTTIREGGKSKSANTSVKINLETMYPPQAIVIIQMGESYNLLAATEYDPSQLPSLIKPEVATQIIVVETQSYDAAGGLTVTRAIYGRDNTTLEAFYCRADGVCAPRSISLEWSQE